MREGYKIKDAIRDNRGQLIGYISENEQGRYAYNSRGLYLGWYSKRDNKSYDNRGLLKGTGDVCSALVWDSWNKEHANGGW